MCRCSLLFIRLYAKIKLVDKLRSVSQRNTYVDIIFCLYLVHCFFSVEIYLTVLMNSTHAAHARAIASSLHVSGKIRDYFPQSDCALNIATACSVRLVKIAVWDMKIIL